MHVGGHKVMVHAFNRRTIFLYRYRIVIVCSVTGLKILVIKISVNPGASLLFLVQLDSPRIFVNLAVSNSCVCNCSSFPQLSDVSREVDTHSVATLLPVKGNPGEQTPEGSKEAEAVSVDTSSRQRRRRSSLF